mmetsp:Transcript_11381/g.12868  ORF Transcript_11381/g.12868 Transcript_11381/m.12868 type:complete len:117 (-) Transcript_11381:71-421(-)
MILFIINLFITYPLIIYPSNMVIESYLISDMKKSFKKTWLTNLSRAFLVFITLFIGISLEDTLDRLMSVVGSLTCTPVAFIMPAVFHLQLCAHKWWEKALDWFIIGLGLFLMIFIT